jgi:hypothetical protein
MRNVAVHVEGYHDRDFLRGWLLHRGWKDPGQRTRGRETITNPVSGKDVKGGRFGFLSPGDSAFVEVVPGRGDVDLLDEIGRKARRVVPPEPDELIVVLDVDDPNLVEGTARREQSVHDRLLRSDPGVVREGSTWTLSSGVVVRLALWACDSERCRGVPDVHTLERIVSASIARVYPERASAVQEWLDGRPAAPRTSAKAHSWSYMAGWYADLGCAAFLSNLWDDANVAAALDELLSASGLEGIIRGLE